MTAPMFLLDPLPAGEPAALRLDGPEGRHAATVRRLAAGERVDVTDGRGRLAECVVADAHRDVLGLAVLAWREEPPQAPRLVVVQAIAKGDRGELAVELLTEVGVDEIVPWSAARSVVRWDGPRGERSRARWRSTAREAAKQSRRARWPVLAEPATTKEVGRRLEAADLGVVLHEAATEPLPAPPAGAGTEIVVVVGPEGGIDEAELAAFESAGARPYRLGPTVLRTSTAGVVAASLLLASTGRWTWPRDPGGMP